MNISEYDLFHHSSQPISDALFENKRLQKSANSPQIFLGAIVKQKH